MTQISELERQRALLWREAAHDLRGNLSVVQNAAFELNKVDVPDVIRAKLQASLQKGVASLHALLSELTDLAPLSSHQTFSPPSREGIGLSIVKRLCELLNGSLELQTSPGEGTTFRVSFPSRY